MLPVTPYSKIKVAKKGNNRAKTIGEIKASATKNISPIKVRQPARNPRAMRIRAAH